MTEIRQHNYILFFSLQVAKNIMSKDPIMTETHSKAIRNPVSNVSGTYETSWMQSQYGRQILSTHKGLF